ncbi:hypothetical protein TRICHSKD4_0703 [Roseibium sp. TrichSKD4]|uniref:hypothetical protein n=1 Tax=Roseibium sp. TrichSKD4 TaxID=744980 RepID=UPI0001E56670|nr:hypothetical protein [Roseibium sp. TrichSKD4]EFO33596.1 hypothetical protein TRICHSKD4_0703 [Roseibium sp. TrichSKD4]
MIENVILWATSIINPIAGTVMIFALFQNEWLRTAPLWHRFGMILSAVGLYGQTARNYLTITTGVPPRDIEMPWWVLKDFGLAFLAFYFLFLCLKKRRIR